MVLALLTSDATRKFVTAAEVFPDVHLGKSTNDKLVLVVGCRVAIIFDDKLSEELDRFYKTTWGSRDTLRFSASANPMPLVS